MLEREFVESVDQLLGPIGHVNDGGEEFDAPPLAVLGYSRRRVRLHWLPVVGRGRAVVAVVRQPVDVGLAGGGYERLVRRVARAVHGRYPGWPRGDSGFVIGLTAIVLTPEPIGPEDDERLARVLSGGPRSRSRVVTLGLLRVNLGQGALSFALNPGPRDLFPEPFLLADAFSERFGRFVPLM